MAKSMVLSATEIRLRIHDLRRMRVILDFDLARIYGVSTRVFNQAIRRNGRRFPPDFMFQLSTGEAKNLRSQIVTSSSGYGGHRYRPHAFSEHGLVMAANVLRSPRAVKMSVAVVRAFVQLRRLALTHAELTARLDQLEAKYDGQFQVIFDAIRGLMEPPQEETKREPIGFHSELNG